ncbi:MAG TPA: amidohydrolase family protein, partial [Acidimicrobiales bacterium]|nr:amidohydrolase family protein [Acidimicrobiales bacterium]
GGRVIDPESGLDAVRNVGVDGTRIAAITTDPLPGARSHLDASGMVVSPGFIDMHSHAGSIAGCRLQALDGVTTALELEAGISPVDLAYRLASDEGRPIHYGFSASWAISRMMTLAGISSTGQLSTFLSHIAEPAWQRAATSGERSEILARMHADLTDGALGVGILAGYAPRVDPGEYLAIARLAAEVGCPTYTHARDLVEIDAETPIDGAEEIVGAALDTGAQMHYCHLNSTSRRHVGRVLDLVAQARQEGASISTEAYPYGAGMTGIGAGFLAPERLAAAGLSPSSLRYVPTGERVASDERLAELRQADPGGLAFVDFLDEDDADDLQCLLRAQLFPDAVIASDAMPITWTDQGVDPSRWPLPASAVTHPRTAGTFAKSFRVLYRERSALSLIEVVSRCSYLPAKILEGWVPAMRHKGRMTEGCDADITIFDPDAIGDTATSASSTSPSEGIRFVLVNGTFVVHDGRLVEQALPGCPIRS